VSDRPSSMVRELGLLVGPVGQGALWAVERMHWWLGLLLLTYLFSGITVVQPDEVAVTYRFGALVGDGQGAVREPGLLLALPRPIERVVRVPVARVFQTELRDLHFTQSEDKVTRYLVTNRSSLDPERTGYALTGDQNIVHIAMVARWQVRDPIAWSHDVERPEALLRAAVLRAAVATVGGASVDGVLSDRRQSLVDDISRRADASLEAWGAGVSIVSLELLDLTPPQQVNEAFRDVQTAAIESETRIRSAEEYREVQLPKARSDKTRAIQAAESDALERVQTARSEAEAFLALAAEHRTDAGVVRERLYREGMEAVLKGAGKVEFLPPPVGGRYSGSRLTLPSGAKRRSGGRDE